MLAPLLLASMSQQAHTAAQDDMRRLRDAHEFAVSHEHHCMSLVLAQLQPPAKAVCSGIPSNHSALTLKGASP